MLFSNLLECLIDEKTIVDDIINVTTRILGKKDMVIKYTEPNGKDGLMVMFYLMISEVYDESITEKLAL